MEKEFLDYVALAAFYVPAYFSFAGVAALGVQKLTGKQITNIDERNPHVEALFAQAKRDAELSEAKRIMDEYSIKR